MDASCRHKSTDICRTDVIRIHIRRYILLQNVQSQGLHVAFVFILSCRKMVDIVSMAKNLCESRNFCDSSVVRQMFYVLDFAVFGLRFARFSTLWFHFAFSCTNNKTYCLAWEERSCRIACMPVEIKHFEEWLLHILVHITETPQNIVKFMKSIKK